MIDYTWRDSQGRINNKQILDNERLKCQRLRPTSAKVPRIGQRNGLDKERFMYTCVRSSWHLGAAAFPTAGRP